MPYYISPRFLDTIAVHITKNFLDLPRVRVPLILGIHGRKGEGKTFQCERVFDKMGIDPVTISGGELESPDAGDPSRLLRLRYREAAEQIKVQGRMCVIFINDLDAGAGRFDSGTQYTVNTQLVNATLMNIADNPSNVQLPGSYDETPLPRIPIIVTGNDFSTLYAPLVRDGRMSKFFWEPTKTERVEIVKAIFQDDGLSSQNIEQFVNHFSNQAIDFFSAVRSRLYDQQIQNFIHQIGIDKISKRLVNSTEAPPKFNKPKFNLNQLIEFGELMVGEQKRIQELRLVEEYNQFRTFNSTENKKAKPVENSALKASPPIQHLPYNPIMPPHSINSKATAVMQGNETGTTVVSDGQAMHTKLSLEIVQQIEQILEQGYRVGLEYADKRRFKTGSWKSYPLNESNQQADIIHSIEMCFVNHPQDYIRLLGIDPKAKRRVVEETIQRP
ncbi:MAG: ribulose bisphosphate carboxylase small subunit [Microcoleaceae cyanobacterium]